jgi:hypothetical protein
MMPIDFVSSPFLVKKNLGEDGHDLVDSYAGE